MERLSRDLQRIYRNRSITPVIVQSSRTNYSDIKSELQNLVPLNFRNPFQGRVFLKPDISFTRWKELPSFNMIATALTPNLIEKVAQMRSVNLIYPDYTKFALQFPTVPQQGVFQDFQKEPFTTTFWTKKLLGLERAAQQGITGKGVRVAVLDTGARRDLPQIRHVKTLSAMKEKGGTGVDANGHGTWCTSCLGGKSAIDQRYSAPVEGMAPDADLFSIQVLGFVVGMGTTSDVLEGMQMALQLNAKVVSMSLGSEESPPDAENPEAVAVNTLTSNGTIVVVAGGNSGPEPSTIGSPGSVLNSLTVGAINPMSGELGSFSSRGPTSSDGLIKPDIVGYGVRIDSQLTGALDEMVDRTQQKYGSITGTSMATPGEAGVVACMAQLYRDRLRRDLTTQEIKTMMEQSSEVKDNNIGWGLLNWDVIEQWVENND